MKRILLALALLLLPSAAFAQCNGIFSASNVCGTTSAGPGIPGPLPLSSFALAPGGVSGNVQTNNGSGGLAGIIDAQLTAKINPFTSSLSGAVPASGGSATNLFLNQAGTFTSAGTGIRQAILSSAVNTVGAPAFANVGSGLNVNLTATATPMVMSFAAGFNSSGVLDFIGTESADVTSFWASLPANQYSFLAIDRNAGTGALTASQTLVRPQKGPVFYAPRQALVHFVSNITDDWGNTWTSSGATFTAGCAKFGATGMRLSGTASFAQSAQILNPGQGAWTINHWFSVDSNVSASIMGSGNPYGIYVATNGSGKLTLFLSSGGASWDISPGSSAGATTVTAAALHHLALVYNPLAATYVLYLDGIAQLTVSSTAIVWPEAPSAAMIVGNAPGGGAPSAGCWTEFEFVPYAKWVANFTPPVAASTVSGDWFDSNTMTMKTATGAGPTWTVVQRQYVAEAVTVGGAVSAVYNYSSTSSYRGGAVSIDGNGLTRVGNHVTFAAASQFITNWATLGAVYTWVISPSVVPPNAVYFYVQVQVAHAALAVTTGTTNQDCTFASRLPVGTAQNGAILVGAYGNYTGMGTATNTAAFTEGVSTVLQVPVINGIPALETIITGTTCSQQAGNASQIKQAVVVGYDLP